MHLQKEKKPHTVYVIIGNNCKENCVQQRIACFNVYIYIFHVSNLKQPKNEMPIANLPVILTTNTVVKPFTMMVKARHTFVAHRTVLAFGTSVQETEKKYYQW